MINNKISLKIKKAYTLIELSIVIVIISLMMSGVFNIITGSVITTKNSITAQDLNVIYEAMGTFLTTQKRLPCPASLTSSINDDATFGNESGSGSGCVASSGIYQNGNLFYGAVPTKALNISVNYAFDEYGNKINYIIDQRFTFNFVTSPANDLTGVNSFGTIQNPVNIMTVNEKISTSATTITNDAILVLFSNGANGFGAFGSNGIQNTLSTDADEIENQLNSSLTPTFNNIFISNSAISDKFDDILLFKTQSYFINDFSASNLIACPGNAINNINYTAKTLYNNQYLYANAVCASNDSVIKIIQCVNGSWQNVVSECP